MFFVAIHIQLPRHETESTDQIHSRDAMQCGISIHKPNMYPEKRPTTPCNVMLARLNAQTQLQNAGNNTVVQH